MRMRKKKAISPVIATVILIAVAVAIGLAVSFWASGLTGTLTKYERLNVNVAYAEAVPNTGWNVTLQGVNMGSSDSTINLITFNGKPLDISTINHLYVNGVEITPPLPATVQAGKPFTMGITIPSSYASSGQTVEIALITATGTNYPKSLVLP